KDAMKKLLIFLHIFVGIGALFEGVRAVLNPIKPVGITVGLLKNYPLINFLIPGIILFVVIGLGNIFAAAVLYKDYDYSFYVSHFMGLMLVGWIVVQSVMMRIINLLDIIYFIIGGVEMLISLRLIMNKRSLY
ncbi:MAG: hypothetical protein ACOCQZ_03185, partial [Halanaerobium sp.]